MRFLFYFQLYFFPLLTYYSVSPRNRMPWGKLHESLGSVWKDLRTDKVKWSVAEMATKLNISEAELTLIESGKSDIEYWGPVLASIAVELGVPTRTLICERGERGEQFQYCNEYKTGEIIARVRHKKNKTLIELTKPTALTIEELMVRWLVL